jgi:ech hydrogenase subunit C
MGRAERSPWLIHYDGSSCNGCDIEVLACLTPVYDAERFGCIVTGDPKQADIFLVTGGVNALSGPVLRNIYAQMPEPRVVVAIGACAYSGGIFAECHNIGGGVATAIPVDVYVAGCAARPESILDGVLRAAALLAERRAAMKNRKGLRT